MKTQAKHTPGPWEVKQAWVIDNIGNIIPCGYLVSGNQDEPVINPNSSIFLNKNDAILISVVPELLETCKEAQEIVKIARKYFPKSIKNNDKFSLEVFCAKINSVIAKASASE